MIIADLENAIRQLYYAKACLDRYDIWGAICCIDIALKQLGVVKPEDVGLSSSSLNRK